MAGRKARIFPIFEDVPEVIDRLTDAQLGRVFRQTLNSYFGKETREDGDALVDFVALMLLKQAERYDRYREGQRAHGRKSTQKAEEVSPEGEVCEEAEAAAMVCTEEAEAAMVCTEEAAAAMGRVMQGNAGYGRLKEGNDPPSPSPGPSPSPSPKKNILCSTSVELLNSLSGSSFRATTKATQRLLAARSKEGLEPWEIAMGKTGQRSANSGLAVVFPVLPGG